MRTAALWGEAVAMTRAQRVSTILVALLVCAMCATTLLTVGRSAAAQQEVHQRIDEAGARTVTLTDRGDEGLVSATSVEVIDALSSVAAAIGITTSRDVVNGAIGDGATRVPAREVIGDMTGAVELLEGRWPMPGEAVVTTTAQDQLGMDLPYGYVTGDAFAADVVGRVEPRGWAAEWLDLVLVQARPETNGDAVVLVAADAGVVTDAVRNAQGVLSPTNPDDLAVESPASLAQVQKEIGGVLGEFARQLLAGVLLAGGALVCLVVLSDVLVNRVDLGRRRALGASRGTLTLLTVARTVIAAVLGALGGVAGGSAVALRLHAFAGWEFAAATAVMAVFVAVIAAVVPSVYASLQDPVRVLRTA